MNHSRQSTSRRLIIVTALLATLLGGAYVGFTTSAPPEHTSTKSTPVSSSHRSGSDTEAESATGSKPSVDSKSDADKTEKDQNELRSRVAKFLRSGDDLLLRDLLPRGISSAEGAGGVGLNRQVKSNGVWFPVFDLSKARKKDGSPADDLSSEDIDPDSVELAEIPLDIASAPPPPVITSETLEYPFAAVGGTPPYQWHLTSGGQGFTLDPNAGLLRGSSEMPTSLPMSITVTDAVGAQSAMSFTLVIRPAEPLTIVTGKLPIVEVQKVYQTQMQAQGGLPPYSWSMSTPVALVCDPASGVVSGTVTEPGDYEATVKVTDAQDTTAEAKLSLRVSAGLEITSENPLPSATPGQSYRFQLEASGGTPPYAWAARSGLPSGLLVSPDGLIQGTAGDEQRLHQVDIVVTDAEGLTFKATMEIAVMQSLIVVPSNQKAGLAWRPATIARTVKRQITGFAVVRTSGGDSGEVYRGTASHFVDHNLAVGASYSYQLMAFTSEGQRLVVGQRDINILPVTLQRARPGATGDPYADRVVKFEPLTAGGYGTRGLPGNVTGPPDGRSTYSAAYTEQQVASLHASNKGGGSITLEFTDNIIESAAGMDFTVFENVFFRNGDPNQRFMEPATVEVALFDGEWFRIPCAVSPTGVPESDVKRPTYYAQGFAGVNATTGENPTDASRSGGDSFDASVVPLSWFRYIRIRSTGDNAMRDTFGTAVRHTTEMGATSGSGSSGFDLDAVSAVNY